MTGHAISRQERNFSQHKRTDFRLSSLSYEQLCERREPRDKEGEKNQFVQRVTTNYIASAEQRLFSIKLQKCAGVVLLVTC